MHTVIRINLALCLVLSFSSPVLQAVEIEQDKPRHWEINGFFSASALNGGLIGNNLFTSWYFKKNDDEFAYIVDGDIERYSERVLVRQDTGEPPSPTDEVPASDPEDLRYTVSNLEGLSRVGITVQYRADPKLHYFTKIESESNKARNISSTERLLLGSQYTFIDTKKEKLTLSAALGFRALAPVVEADFDETILNIGFHYANQLGERSELSVTAVHEIGEDLAYTRAQFGLHFWMTRNLAIAMINRTVRYDDKITPPAYIEGGSDSLTLMSIVFTNNRR